MELDLTITKNKFLMGIKPTNNGSKLKPEIILILVTNH